MAIDSDYTSSLYNSYFDDIASLDVAVSALDGYWNLTSWNALTETQKENLMHGATADFNAFCYLGTINNSISSPYNMKFPRSGVYYQNGVSIGNTETPIFAKAYIAERVLEKNANIETGKFYDGRIKKNKLGKLEQEFHNPRDSRILRNTLRSASSFSNIRPYITGLSGNFRYVQRA
ncbi:MAG: hypothetical protein K0U78_15150 [Actinomycetia bacterium]|nr:hypothetical protein [Actinomycetes bacterium]